MICKQKSTKLNSFKFTNNFIKHQTFIYTQLNDQTVLFQTIQSSRCQSIAVYHLHQSFNYAQLNDQTALFQTI